MNAVLTHQRLNNGKTGYSLSSRFFEVGDKHYEVIASTSTGRGVHDVTHTIRCVETGKVYDIPMIDLIKKLK